MRKGLFTTIYCTLRRCIQYINIHSSTNYRRNNREEKKNSEIQVENLNLGEVIDSRRRSIVVAGLFVGPVVMYLVGTTDDSFERLLTIEQCSRLLECAVLRLDDEEVDEHELEGDPTTVHDVVMPRDVLECDGVDVLVEDERQRDSEVEDRETLGADRVGQDFNGVGHDERSESNTRNKNVSISENPLRNKQVAYS